MMSTLLPTTVKLSESVLFQQMSEEGVLLDMDSEQYFGLDDISLRIWQLLAEDQKVADVLAKLQEEYDVTEEILKQDLGNVLTQLQTDKLVTLEY